MSKLRKFRTLEEKVILGLKIFCCLLILTIIVMGKSFAEYKQEAEVTFIRARVGKFKTNDIELAMKLDGEEVETPPSKDNYTVDISCDNADGSWDYDEWLAKIGNIRAGKVKCEVNFNTPEPTLSEVTIKPYTTSIELTYTAAGTNTIATCKYGKEEGNYSNIVSETTNSNCSITGLEKGVTYYYQVCAVNGGGEVCKTGNAKTYPLSEQVELGDYIIMTPTATSYTISKDLTGYSEDQTINPSELNLWRILKKNEDGTILAVSDKVSKGFYFKGETGYKNYIHTLKVVGEQFRNMELVEGSRIIGKSPQVDICESVFDTECVTKYPNEPEPEKDEDLSLLMDVLGSYKSGSGGSYWIPYRGTNTYNNSTLKRDFWLFEVGTSPTGFGSVYNRTDEGKFTEGLSTYRGVRPVVTVKSSVILVSGDGKSAETAYSLE